MKTMLCRNVAKILGVLLLLVVMACWTRGKNPTVPTSVIDSGNCPACLFGAADGLSSFIVRTDADYESFTTQCNHISQEWLPPRPGSEEVLVFVSGQDSGCIGCFNIVNFRETNSEAIVVVEGGFHGACEMLITLGAWALVPETNKPITFEFHEALCSDE